MRNRIFTVLAVAMLAGGGLAYGTYNMMHNQPVKTVTMPTQPVVVATADLAARRGAEEGGPEGAVLPRRAGARGRLREAGGDIVGRGLIVSVVRNEPILAGKLASKEAGTGLPPVIPDGMRAMSVRVNEVIGVAGYVLPGTRVDVVATASPTNQPEDMTSKVVLSNVKVLAAGTRLEQDPKDGKPVQVTVVTHARDAGAGRASDAGEHRRQDSARAAQPARSERAGDTGHQAGRAARLGKARGRPAHRVAPRRRSRASR